MFGDRLPDRPIRNLFSRVVISCRLMFTVLKTRWDPLVKINVDFILILLPFLLFSLFDTPSSFFLFRSKRCFLSKIESAICTPLLVHIRTIWVEFLSSKCRQKLDMQPDRTLHNFSAQKSVERRKFLSFIDVDCQILWLWNCQMSSQVKPG